MDGWRFATADDPAELLLLRATLERAIEIGDQRDERLARRIIVALADAFKK